MRAEGLGQLQQGVRSALLESRILPSEDPPHQKEDQSLLPLTAYHTLTNTCVEKEEKGSLTLGRRWLQCHQLPHIGTQES